MQEEVFQLIYWSVDHNMIGLNRLNTVSHGYDKTKCRNDTSQTQALKKIFFQVCQVDMQDSPAFY